MGRKFVIRTDHIALKHLLTSKELTALQARQLDFISQFGGMEIQHRPGVNHSNVDALSRPPVGIENMINRLEIMGSSEDDRHMDEAETVRQVLTRAGAAKKEKGASGHKFMEEILQGIASKIEGVDIGREQQRDDVISEVMKLIEQNRSSTDCENLSATVRKLFLQKANLCIIDGLLWHRMRINRSDVYRVVLPSNLQERIMQACHLEVGHQGCAKTGENFRRKAYFPGWKKKLEEICRECSICQRFQQGQNGKHGSMQLLEVKEPMERVSCDLTGPHPRSNKGNVYLLTMLDGFSRFLIAVPIPNKFASTVAKAIHRNLFAKFGLCRVIQSDRGKEFQSGILQGICDQYGIKLVQTTAGRPNCNGRIERVHGSLNRLIAKHINQNQKNWCELVEAMVYTYNSTVHSSTGYSPFELWCGRQPLTPVDLKCGMKKKGTEPTAKLYKDKLAERMNKIYIEVQKRS